MLGASGALMGTRCNAPREFLWSPEMNARLTAAGGDDTEQTGVFDFARGISWPAQYPGRAIKNEFLERWHGHEILAARSMLSITYERVRRAREDFM